MPGPIIDEQHLRRVLELAREGVGLTSPNPCVGAVIVDAAGSVVGEGSHTYEGLKHAEILALDQAAGKARGATVYINLEPCCHQGRTAPCVSAIVSAGIKRVVACMKDPNPLVRGKGFESLREAGIEVSVGLFEKEARKLNEAFAKYIRTRTPLVTLKSAMTLDGKIAPQASASAGDRWITGETARAHVQELRHQNDAILVGVGTIVADDPLLTDRSGRPRRRPLLRVILDSRLRLPLHSRVVQTAKDDVLVLCSAPDEKLQELQQHGIRVERVPTPADGRPDMQSLVRCLGEMEITSLLIEGGATINGTALSCGIVDKLFLYYAPKIFGDGAVPFAAGAELRQMNEALSVKSIELHRFGEDFAVEGYLKDPYCD